MGKKSGFTLVELSIVLVIIGLIVGGIVGGQSLIVMIWVMVRAMVMATAKCSWVASDDDGMRLIARGSICLWQNYSRVRILVAILMLNLCWGECTRC